MTERSCGTCNMADFSRAMTPTGRFKRDAIGRCGYDIAVPVLPASVCWGRETLGDPNRAKGGISPGDGVDCPVYAPKGKP